MLGSADLVVVMPAVASPILEVPNAEAYRAAFQRLGPAVTKTRRKLLYVHYHALYRQLTMTQIAEAMGWSSYASANSHYGRLSALVAVQTGFHTGVCHLNTLCEFVAPAELGDHWLIIMRPQVAEALGMLGWV